MRDITAAVEQEMSGSAEKIKVAQHSMAALDKVDDRIVVAVDAAAETRTAAAAAAAMKTVEKLAHSHEDVTEDVYKASEDAGDRILQEQSKGVQAATRIAEKIQVNTLDALGSIRDKVKESAFAQMAEMQKAITKLAMAIIKSVSADLKAGRVGAAGDDVDGRVEKASAAMDLINVYRLEIANCKKIIVDADRNFPGSADIVNEAISAEQRQRRKTYAQWAVIAIRGTIVATKSAFYTAIMTQLLGMIWYGTVFSTLNLCKTSVADYIKLWSPTISSMIANSGTYTNWAILGTGIWVFAKTKPAEYNPATGEQRGGMRKQRRCGRRIRGGSMASVAQTVADNIRAMLEKCNLVSLLRKFEAMQTIERNFSTMYDASAKYLAVLAPAAFLATVVAVQVFSNASEAHTASARRESGVSNSEKAACKVMTDLSNELATTIINELRSLSPEERRSTHLAHKIASRLRNQADVACSVFSEIASKQIDNVTLSVTKLATQLDTATCIASNAIIGDALPNAIRELARTATALRREIPVLARRVGSELVEEKYTEIVDAALALTVVVPCKRTATSGGNAAATPDDDAPVVSAGETMADAEAVIAARSSAVAIPVSAEATAAAIESAREIISIMSQIVREHGFKGRLT
jgi:hypothetical protein